MNEQSFDAITRHAAGISRRASLRTLGTVGLAALAAPFSTSARKSKAKKKNKATPNAVATCQQQLTECTARGLQCADQVEPCSTFLTASCGGRPTCVGQAACCSFFERCDAEGFLSCLVTSTN